MLLLINMFPLKRRSDICSIGFWKHDVGRPTDSSHTQWFQRCNFTFKVLHRISTLSDTKFDDYTDLDTNCGWLIEVITKDSRKEILISSDVASSNTLLRRRLMTIPGVICRLKSDDFLRFVDADSNKLDDIYVSNYCGKIKVHNSYIWAFPTIMLDANGKKMQKKSVFVSKDFLEKRSNGQIIPLPSIPCPKPMSNQNELGKLSRCMRKYYGPRLCFALHLLTSVLKAVHFDVLLKDFNSVSICNVSGPANIGKTFACAIALSMMGAPGLMLSRCTPTAMIDAAHVFKNMLIVWDDPRDATHSQFSSIVHEAFHGQASTTVSKGVRRYNSSLIIGTQEPLLGMQSNSVNIATFSRLSHVNFNLANCVWQANMQAEECLKKQMMKNDSVFASLISTKYDLNNIKSYLNKLMKKDVGMIIPRALQIAAIDWYFAKCLQEHGFEIEDDELEHYFLHLYVDYLSKHCCRISLIEMFCLHVSQLLEKEEEIPCTFFKSSVHVELKSFGATECFAVYPKAFITFLHSKIPASRSYTKEQLHTNLKNSKYGEVSRNVAFRTLNGTQIRRALVIRRCFLT
jgi:hypothetical protein